MGMGGKGGGGKVEVNDYYMSMHLGLCMGPVDALTGVYVGEKTVWEGELTHDTSVSVSKPNLFGGNKKEGGVSGTIHFLAGVASGIGATLHEMLAARLGKTSDTAPAFTGFASVWMVGSLGNSNTGFMWTSNSPYLKDISIRVKRKSNTFGTKAGEPSNYSDMGDGGKTCNPAHMIYECLTNTDWGMGAGASVIDVSSFQDAAKTFHSEGLGLAMMWAKQSRIEDFVTEILDHVQASLFLSPLTGLLTLRPARGDYVLSSLMEMNRDNCVVTKFQRKGWGEIINEITVSWTNPANEESATYTVHDLAGIAMQGGIVSDTRDYYGVRSADVAAQIANRDIRSASTPLATFEIEANRYAWKLVPGQVVRLTYPEYGIEDLAIRVGKVDYGKAGEPTVKFTAIEDIFGLPQSAYTTPDEPSWTGGAQDPTPLEFTRITTLPTYLAARVAETYSTNIPEYPEVFVGVYGSTTNGDTRYFDIYGEVVQPNGTVVLSNLSTNPLTPRSVLTGALPAEATSTVSGESLGLLDMSVGTPPSANSFVLIGPGGDEETEIALIDSLSADYSSVVLRRGILDTVPRAWPVDTPVLFISDALGSSNARYSDGGTALFKCVTSTSKGVLALGDAPSLTQSVNGRPHYPLRPANVAINGQGYGTVVEKTGADLLVTWANRNRLTEDTQIVPWDSGDVTPEIGQTTTIKVLNLDRSVIVTYAGCTGTSFTLPRAPFLSLGTVIVRVTAVRDGLESLQGHELIVSNGKGWGFDYGNNYGGY